MIYDDNLISTASIRSESKPVKVQLELKEEFKTTASELYQVLTDENVSFIHLLSNMQMNFMKNFLEVTICSLGLSQSYYNVKRILCLISF